MPEGYKSHTKRTKDGIISASKIIMTAFYGAHEIYKLP